MFVARAGRRITMGSELVSLGVCLCVRLWACWETRSLDQKKSRWSPPPLPPPLWKQPRPPLSQWQGVKGHARRSLLAQSQRHSSIPLRSKSVSAWPLPGDQWTAMLFNYKVTTGERGPARSQLLHYWQKTPLCNKNPLSCFFNLAPDDIAHHEVYLTVLTWQVLNDLHPHKILIFDSPSPHNILNSLQSNWVLKGVDELFTVICYPVSLYAPNQAVFFLLYLLSRLTAEVTFDLPSIITGLCF